MLDTFIPELCHIFNIKMKKNLFPELTSTWVGRRAVLEQWLAHRKYNRNALLSAGGESDGGRK